MNRIVEVVADKVALIERSQEIILSRLQAAIESRDRFTIALSGGSTPRPLYEALSSQALPWSKIHIFWGDERYVPATHQDSNQLMARQAWLDKIEIPDENIHPMHTNSANPAQDAQKHEAELQKFFQTKTGEIPVFDLILLGMGDDGHTASLFPHTDALTVSDRLVTVGNKDGQPRLTFTVPLINQARCVLFVVAGANKRPALKQVFAEQADAMNYPSRLIQSQGELFWLLDRAAGAEL
ncbi:6-phosphogluconolactonase [Pleurocapsa sp. PCC 7319]|uniref:6-phosphogluconolactonase n=1 Tax=Pleurocapsa sp. PCC 7319 TaxID=118161 RepID=UPI000345D331|nr:6-phosphogluconolactonase [Pleurocapsa sp. PCC 7319]